MQHVFFCSSGLILKGLSTFTNSIIGALSPLQKEVVEVFSVLLKKRAVISIKRDGLIYEFHNVILNFLRFNVANATLRTSLTYKRCQNKLLREEVQNKKLLGSQLDRDSKLLYNNVKLALNIIGFYPVLNLSLMSNKKKSIRTNQIQTCVKAEKPYY